MSPKVFAVLVEMHTPRTPKEGMGPNPWINIMLPEILRMFMIDEASMVSRRSPNPRKKAIKAI